MHVSGLYRWSVSTPIIAYMMQHKNNSIQVLWEKCASRPCLSLRAPQAPPTLAYHSPAPFWPSKFCPPWINDLLPWTLTAPSVCTTSTEWSLHVRCSNPTIAAASGERKKSTQGPIDLQHFRPIRITEQTFALTLEIPKSAHPNPRDASEAAGSRGHMCDPSFIQGP